MQKKELCAKCSQLSGCEWAEREAEQKLEERDRARSLYILCQHALCADGYRGMQRVLHGDRPGTSQAQEYLGQKYRWFTFPSKARPFYVDLATGEVSQPDGDVLIPVGVTLRVG